MASTPRLSRTEIEEYLRLHSQRTDLQRQAKALNKQAEVIEAKLLDYVRAKGGKERAVVSCGHRIALVSANGSVKWKDEFVSVAGLEAAEALSKSVAGVKEELVVEKVA